MFNKLKHSFSARLSVFVLMFSAMIFAAAFVVFYRSSSRIIERNARQEAENTLEIVNLKIENVLRRVESVPDNLKWIVADRGVAPDSMYGITRGVVTRNPDIYGSAIAFEPGYFKEKGHYFSPYSYRDSTGRILSLQLGTDDYDYFTWDWYATPKALGRACWSEPYYDEGGGQMIMCTYSSPIYDREGEFAGIFTSDISLEWLTDMLDGMKRSDQSYTFMLSADGTYIAHYLKERILNATIFGATEDMTDPTVRRLGEEMIAGNRGMEILDNDGVKSFVFYAPVPHTSWSLAIVLPRDEVFAGLHRNNLILIIVFALGLVALFLATWRTVRSLARPLKTFAASARTIARGDFRAQLPAIRSHDEMKELADSFGYMQTELTNYIENLRDTTSAKEKIESELRIAREIQMGMIPKLFPPFPSRKEIDLYAVLHPAKEVGGDLYDFFLEGDNLWFAIGDVSGKGVPASLFMAVTRSLFRSVAGAGASSPAAVVTSLNGSISESNEANMFVTLFIGLLDLRTGAIRYCNAGHNPPIVVSPQGRCAFVNVLPNIPIGVMEGFPYREQETALADGNILMLYTDGVTEAENRNKELYGEMRLMECVCAHAADSPRGQIESILAGISAHVIDQEPSDDITLLAIRYDRNHHDDKQTLIIANRMEELAMVADFVERLGEQLSLSPTLVMNLNLVLEEAIANVILYAYPDGGEKQIELSAHKDGDALVLMLTDSGQAFDPTQQEDPDITISAEERPVGGLGIYLVKKIMNEVEYQRVNGKNVFTMKKIIAHQ